MNSSSSSETIAWDGDVAVGSLRVEPAGGNAPPFVGSHFGSEILTWNIPYLFRTPPGFNLLVPAPPIGRRTAFALEGIVETDWADATFTMNWQITRPHFTLIFEADEPIALIVPQRRGELEGFRPETRPISQDPALNQAHDRWRNSRIAHNAGLKETNSDARRQGWQKHTTFVARRPRTRRLASIKASCRYTALRKPSRTGSRRPDFCFKARENVETCVVLRGRIGVPMRPAAPTDPFRAARVADRDLRGA